MNRRLYLDTSAYLCILLGEEGAERLSEETAGATLLASVLLPLEARRTLIRLARDGILEARAYQACMSRVSEDTEYFVFRDLTLDLCGTTPIPAVSTPRSLDLVHLRTAMWFNAEAPIRRFVTVDAAQARAAQELGLPM
jgi:hypothetical protein